MSAIRTESTVENVGRTPPARITSADFRKRAQHYRLAAALADIPREATMFDQLAVMFEQMARRFWSTSTRPEAH
jgi:sulfite reductase alpha subunit-like flavoprotein